MRSECFDYELPPDRIAQVPHQPRDRSRLLVVPPAGGFGHRLFCDLPALLQPGDLLVLNDTRVRKARLTGLRPGGGSAEVLLLGQLADGDWEAMVRPGGRLKPGTEIVVRGSDGAAVHVAVRDYLPGGTRRVHLEARDWDGPGGVEGLIAHLGSMPLPPYIHTKLDDETAYQTVYSRTLGAAAAPTAGLHMTDALLRAIVDRGVGVCRLTLHVGIGTFRPVKSEEIEQHEMHAEWYSLPAEAALAVNACRGRVVALGTTVVRALESAAVGAPVGARVRPHTGFTQLYITPGYPFRVVDRLVTNFHTPRSSLLILVSAFAGYERVQQTYAEALSQGYRFLSFGDACLFDRAQG